MLPKDLDDNDDYSFEYSPDGVPLDQMEYSSFKSKEDDFGDAIEKINKHMKKGIVIKACDILIRCKKVENGKDFSLIIFLQMFGVLFYLK